MQSLQKLSCAAGLAVLAMLSGCATTTATALIPNIDDPNEVKMIPAQNPGPITTMEVFDPQQNKRVEKDVLAMSADDIRTRLTTTDTFVTVEKQDQSGKFVYVGNGGKVERGVYRITFDFINYTNEPISINGGAANEAIGRIGVGLRIIGDLSTSADSVDLSGLLPIGLAAQQNKVSGQLRFTAYGISHPSLALAVPANAFLDPSGIQKSFEASSAVRVLFNDPKTHLEPYLLGVARVKPDKAKEALDAANAKMTK